MYCTLLVSYRTDTRYVISYRTELCTDNIIGWYRYGVWYRDDEPCLKVCIGISDNYFAWCVSLGHALCIGEHHVLNIFMKKINKRRKGLRDEEKGLTRKKRGCGQMASLHAIDFLSCFVIFFEVIGSMDAGEILS